jgi:chemotaxis protein MotB
VAAEKKGQTIVIKKITIVAGGHGGSWKVALADFMTALMAFFLVMWLLNQSAETKKAVSDYFSSPSLIEYEFSNFGVELTLEKLFLDMVNEPLKAFQNFLEPADKSPNVMDFGSQKVATAFAADKMGDMAKNFLVSSDTIEFDIIDTELFLAGTAEPGSQFVLAMNRIKALTVGLEDAEVKIESRLFHQSVPGSNRDLANRVATERMDLIKAKVQASFEHPSNTIVAKINIQDKKGFIEGQSQRPKGMIHFSIKQKETKADGSKPRQLLKSMSGTSAKNAGAGTGESSDMTEYDKYIDNVTK